MSYNKTRSNAWYLLPIFVGLVGGIIAYFVLRHDDPDKAKKCLYIGIILAVIGIIINILIGPEISNISPGFNVKI